MSFLYPGEYLESTYVIDFDKLYKDGYRGIIFDIDNTLVPHGAPADERAILLFNHLKEIGFSCMLLSNNKEPRVKGFNDAVGVQYMHKAGKPKPSGYKKAMERYKHLNLDYPSGKIIAKATITDCVHVDDNLKEELQEKNPLVYYGILQKDSNWDGYGFKLENIEKIEPIEINGKLSLWDYE